ncbi:histone-like nucleoid-structuring protein Lsr2 [Devriesea agamarum]|uniref:histone-like nucleoid-structuring protein Lsr2 n=1 Tax=Devriesea agamarum TaxID=472569 RepID=UPI00071CC69D|nr:Lsr2 family protein [Devriesea agamarum]
MAREHITIIRDDLDGSEGARSVSFAIEGVQYEIDLAEDNRNKLREALAPFIEKAARMGRDSGRGASRSTGTQRVHKYSREQSLAAKHWAETHEGEKILSEKGISHSPKGRTANAVIEAYLGRHDS